MKTNSHRISTTILTVLVLNGTASAQQWADKLFPTKFRNFGTVAAGARAEFAFVVKNNTNREVHIASVRSSCGCSDVRIENATLQTYESGAVIASVNSQRLRGRQTSTITVVFDRPQLAEVQLRIEVYIRGDVVVSPSEISFGELAQGESAVQVATVTRYGKRDWQILKAEQASPHMTTELREMERSATRVSYQLTVRLAEQTPAGHLRETVLLRTNDAGEATLPVMVEGRVAPAIAVAPAALFWGVVPAGQQASRQIVVRGKSPFRIVRAWADCDCMQIALPETDAPKAVHLLRVTFSATGEQRGLRRTLRLETDGGVIVELVAHAAVKSE